MSRNTTYYQAADGQWSSTALLPGMMMPTPRQKPVLPASVKVQPLSELVEGRRAFRISNSTETTVLIPDLNYLEVRNETATNGRVRELFNIRVGEQPANLFAPTAGAPVRQVSSPDELWKR